MKHTEIIEKLSTNRLVFEGLLKNKTRTEYLWKPKENKWCLLEIVCHLYDEECEDFRTRVKQTLELPGTPPPPIDPVNWVTQRQYIEQNYDEMVNKFLNERINSVDWLRSLTNPDWSNNYKHPELGPLSAELFLTNWMAHDILHFRQIIKLQYKFFKSSTDIDLTYAGSW